MSAMDNTASELRLSAEEIRTLLEQLGPSLGLWRAAEIAALRTQVYDPPVLDLGCGDGLVTSYVLSSVDIGVDPSHGALERAATRGLYRQLEGKPIEATDIAPASIGTVVCNSVLEHIADLDDVLRAIVNLLRPGGRLIFTVPTEAFSDWLAIPNNTYRDWRNRHYEHRNLWTVEHWRDELRRYGLRLTLVQPYLQRHMVTLWDALELVQRVWIGRYRVFGVCWRRIPRGLMERLAARAAEINFATDAPGGGRLMVAERI